MDDKDKERAEKLAAMRKKAAALKAKKGKKDKKVKEETSVDASESPDTPVAEAFEEPEGELGSEPVDEKEKEHEKEKDNEDDEREEAGEVDVADVKKRGEGEGVAIYKKQVARIEELERENRRLTRELEVAERGGGDADSVREDSGEVGKLKEENEALQRQIKQLQGQLASKRHGSSSSVSLSTSPPAAFQEQLDAKTATIESMESELSKLQAQVDKLSLEAKDSSEIEELKKKLEATEEDAETAEKEVDELTEKVKKLEQQLKVAATGSTDEKVVLLEGELSVAITALRDTEQKVEGLEKKILSLTTLQKEQESRLQALRAEKEAADLKIARLQEQKAAQNSSLSGGLDDEGVDELLNEEKQKLEARIRDLETEVSELRRGIWRDQRKSMAAGGEPVFQDVDLGGGGGGSGHGHRHSGHHRKLTATGGITEFLANGLSALAGGSGSPGAVGGFQKGISGDDDDSLLSDDGDIVFDEEAFRKAREEEARERLERVRDLKKGLKNWEGWRLDLVDIRRGIPGFGDVFEV